MYKKSSIARGFQRTEVTVFFSRIELVHFFPVVSVNFIQGDLLIRVVMIEDTTTVP